MQRDSIAIPVAIIIAAALIAGAIFFSNSKKQAVPTDTPSPTTQDGKAAELRKVDSKDHIRGNPNAPIMLVEYSDLECPWCKVFHETLQKVITEYGPSGKVAWVFRHAPIAQLHPNAPKISEASECVTELGGDFWKFTDTIYGSRDIKEFTNMTKLAEYAMAAGVTNKDAFQKCLDSGKYTAHIEKSVAEFAAITAGKGGTPHTLIVVGDQSYPIEGAQPYDVVKQMIGNMISQMEGATPAGGAQ